jgi:hypothetical protein
VRFPGACIPSVSLGRGAGDDAFVLWAVVLVVFSLAGAALSLVFGLTR